MENEKFKIKLEPFFYAISSAYGLTALAFIAFSKLDWGLIRVYYWTFPIGMIFTFGLAVLFRGIYQTILSGQQLSGITVHGFRIKMDLSNIDRVRPFSLGVISFLRVFEKKRRNSIWLPMVHENQKYFEKLIISRTNNGHPLRKYFMDSNLKEG